MKGSTYFRGKEMKNFWRIALLGYLYGMFALIICVLAVVTDIVEDMGIAILALPVVCPILFILFGYVSKGVWQEVLYGRGAFVRWSVTGALAGLLYTIRVILEQRVDYAGMYGVVLLVVFLIVFWLIFFRGRGKA
jgi:hypothetical protein